LLIDPCFETDTAVQLPLVKYSPGKTRTLPHQEEALSQKAV